MTDIQLRDRLNEIMAEEIGDVLRNKEVDAPTQAPHLGQGIGLSDLRRG